MDLNDFTIYLCLDAAFHLCDRLDHSVEINQQTKEGSTLLHLAAKMGNESLIDYLIDRKADINSLYTSKVRLSLKYKFSYLRYKKISVAQHI